MPTKLKKTFFVVVVVVVLVFFNKGFQPFQVGKTHSSSCLKLGRGGELCTFLLSSPSLPACPSPHHLLTHTVALD